MPLSFPRTALHVAAASYMFAGFSVLQTAVFSDWLEGQVGGHFQFLTIDGLCVAGACLAFSVLADLAPSVKVFRTIKRALLLIALPVETVVSTIYWSLLILAPSLILPPKSDDVSSSDPTVPALFYIPLWMDLALHATPAIALLIDFFAFEQPYRGYTATWGATLAALLACVSYASFAEWCAAQNGTFPYPFLTLNPLPIRCAIYGGATAFALGSFWALNGVKKALQGGGGKKSAVNGTRKTQ